MRPLKVIGIVAVLPVTTLLPSTAWANDRLFLWVEGGYSTWRTYNDVSGTGGQVTARAGYDWWQAQRYTPRLQGQGYVQASGFFGEDLSGSAWRGGGLLGPEWEYFLMKAGVELNWDRYLWGVIPIHPAHGVSFPIEVTGRLNAVFISAGVDPRFFISTERAEVDWSEYTVRAIGDEFTWHVSAGLGQSLGQYRHFSPGLSLRYLQSTFGSGVYRDFTILLDISL